MVCFRLVRLGWLVATLGLLGLSGCGSTGTNGTGGDGGSGAAGMGGAGATGGTGGSGGGAMADAEAVCRQWCRNEEQGPSCCVFDCRTDCLEPCLEAAAGACGSQWIAARECQLDAACDDFFQECETDALGATQCVFEEDAPEVCQETSMVCQVDSETCVSEHVGDSACAVPWANYARCVLEPFRSCEQCADAYLGSLGECGFPSGAGLENFGDNPPQCLDLPMPLFGCGQRCPGGSDNECNFRTFCSANNFCDAECFVGTDCGNEELCDLGRCQPIPPQCGEDDALNPAHDVAEQVLECAVMGIPIPLEIALTADPTAVVGAGDNTFDVQMQLSLPIDVVNLVINLTSDGVVTDFVGTVVPTAGTSDANTVQLSPSPLACDVTFIQDRRIDIPTQPAQGTWALDQGSTQELTLQDVRFELDVAGLVLELATDGDDPSCAWAQGGPPSLQFSVPPN